MVYNQSLPLISRYADKYYYVKYDTVSVGGVVGISFSGDFAASAPPLIGPSFDNPDLGSQFASPVICKLITGFFGSFDVIPR